MKIKHKYLVNDPRNGRDRYYVRKTGYPKIRIKSNFNTPAFWLEYNNALRKLEDISKVAPPSKFGPGSLGWLYDQYMISPEFENLSAATRKERMLVYKRVCSAYGAISIDTLTPLDFYALRDAQADTPSMANKFILFTKYAFKWGRKRTLINVDPVSEVEYLKYESEGFIPWTEDDVKAYVTCWPLGTRQYLALIILATINGRRGDAVKFGPQNIRDDLVSYRQEKTKSSVKVNLSPFLTQAANATETGEFTLLIGDHGRPYKKESFGNAFKKWCRKAGINQKGKSTHGVRKAFAGWAAEAGATDEQLMAGFGWRNREQATTYTKHAQKAVLAKPISEAANAKLSHLLETETSPNKQAVVSKGKYKGSGG